MQTQFLFTMVWIQVLWPESMRHIPPLGLSPNCPNHHGLKHSLLYMVWYLSPSPKDPVKSQILNTVWGHAAQTLSLLPLWFLCLRHSSHPENRLCVFTDLTLQRRSCLLPAVMPINEFATSAGWVRNTGGWDCQAHKQPDSQQPSDNQVWVPVLAEPGNISQESNNSISSFMQTKPGTQLGQNDDQTTHTLSLPPRPPCAIMKLNKSLKGMVWVFLWGCVPPSWPEIECHWPWRQCSTAGPTIRKAYQLETWNAS